MTRGGATPDFRLGSAADSGAAASLAALHEALGLILEPDKHQAPSSINVFLGVVCDVSAAHSSEPVVVFRLSRRRVEGVLAMLDEASVSGLPAAPLA
jgi:hypothetical protein